LDFGLGRSIEPGMPAYGGQVPEPRGSVAQAAATIGQDRLLASPLGLAGMVATVAEGRWRAPRILPEQRAPAGPRLPASEVERLRTLTRAVVTEGTGEALATIPEELHGKSGTAEYGTGDPPPTHAWFVAYRGDLAIAVLVENGRAGGSVAAPIAARFFRSLR